MDFTNALCVRAVQKGLPNLWLSDSMKDQVEAQRACGRCPVRQECATYAAKVPPDCGIWAGQLYEDGVSITNG